MDTLFWFMFLARPQPANPDYSRVPAAFVNAWVAGADEPIAEQIARNAVEGEQWKIERLQEWSVVSPQSYKYSPGKLKHFEHARLNGHCLVFHPWPTEEVNGRQTA
jgi:hypothetical protein